MAEQAPQAAQAGEEPLLPLPASAPGYLSEAHAQFEWPEPAPRTASLRRPTALRLDGDLEVASESHAQFSAPPPTRRPPPARRSTALHLEGRFVSLTSETHDNFVEFAAARRAEFQRRPTNLTLQSESPTPRDTEHKENFVEPDLSAEPPARKRLAKRPTNLRLEGELEITPEHRDRFTEPPPQPPTPAIYPQDNLVMEAAEGEGAPCMSESRAQYVNHADARRRPLARRHSTNLKMEGEMEAVPEYREAFVALQGERQPMVRPRPNLSPSGGEMFLETEKSANFIDFHSQGRRPPFKRHATNMKLEGALTATPEYRDAFKEYDQPRRTIRKPEPQVTLGGTLSGNSPGSRKRTQSETEAGEKPEAATTAAPPYSEYKDWYLDFPRKQPLIQKPEKEYNFRFDAGMPSPAPSRKCAEPDFRGDVYRTPKKTPRSKTDLAPEYRASFLDFPRTRPVLRRPADLLQPPDASPTNRVSEKQHQFVRFEGAQRPALARRSPSLKPLGMLDFEPEYRKAFVVHPRDEIALFRTEPSPRPRRRTRRVTYNVEQDTTEDSTDQAEAEGEDSFAACRDSAFQVLDADVADPDHVADRVTSLYLSEPMEPLRSPQDPLSGPSNGIHLNGGHRLGDGAGSSDPYLDPQAQGGQDGDYGAPGSQYCGAPGTPMYLTAAPYYCTGSSPPHHLYFGGFCPNWSPTHQTYTPGPYCPSLAPGTAPPTASTPATPQPPPPPPPTYCPSILPPVHPYVVGCCPPPAIILPGPMECNANQEAYTATAATSTAAPATTTATTQTTATPPSEPAADDNVLAPRAFVVLEQTRNAANSSSDSNNNVQADKPPTPPGPSSGYE